MKNTFTISKLLFLFFSLLSIGSFSQNAPTAFTPGARTISTLDFSWTDGGGGDVFVVARHTAAIAGNPTDGNTYVVGDAIGAAKVVYIGAAANFSDDFSTNGPAVTGTQYFYKIWNRKNTGNLFSSGLTGSLFTISAVPTNQVTLAAFSNITNTAIRANWTEATGTSGTGTNRLVIVKKGSAVDATPTDGISYTANAAFGTVGTEIGPAGNFVVYNGTALNVTVTGLTNGDYFFKVFTFNGSAGTENYLTSTAGVEGNQGTNPSAQPTALTFSSLLNNGQGYTLTWTPVPATTVDGYIVIRKIGSAPTNAPADGNTTYTVGNEIVASSGEFVAFIGSAATFNESSLAPTTNYVYRVYSYNGSGSGINYNATAPLGGNRITLRTEPTGQSTDITFASVTNTTMSVDWTKASAGAGNNMIVIGKAGSAPTAPTDGNTYTANLAFGTGGATSSTDGGSSFVVYKGSADSPITVTGLSPDTEYFFRAFEFNSTTALDENYNTATGTNNDGTQKQATTNEPINQVTAAATPFANITGTTMRVTWTAAVAGALAPTNYLVNAINKTAPGTYKTVADGTPIADDTDLTIATGNKDGAQNITVGTNLANWTGLDPGQEYEFQIYSYRTSSFALNPDFKTTTPATVTGFTEPGAHTAITFGTIDNSSIAINLSAVSSAAGVVVLRRSGSAPTAPTIVDGTVYTVGATNIAGGTNDVVYVGPISNFVDNDAGNGLNPSTAYHYIAFTYSGSGSKINYLTSGIPAAVNATTLAGGATTTVTVAAGGEAATIPSTTTTTPGISVFNFTVVDDASSSTKTKITDIVINRKDLASGDIDDWSAVIGGARLSGSHGNTGTTGITAISVAPGPNITANSITFSGIPTTAEALGELDNGETLTYTLEVWLKPSLGSATIDGLNFVFQVTPNSSSFTTTAGDSFDTSGSAIESGNTNNLVSVVADRIRITTQPSSPVNATAALAQQPVFEATDVNNNRDLGFNNAVASVNTGAPANLGPVYTPFSFVSGVATFSDLRFNNVGSSTMTITANSITSSPASSSITVEAATNLSGGGLVGINAGPNLINSTTNQAVFGFTLTTTGTTLNFTDATITTTSDPDVAFKPSSVRLFRSTDNSISTAGDNTLISSTYTTPGNSIDFSPFSTSINGTTSNFFIVVDIQDFYPTSLPTIQLSLTNADFTVSTGGKTGATQTGVNYTLQDNTPPTVLSIVPVLSNNGPNGISATSALTYTVTFSEPVTGVSASDFVTTSNPLVGTLAFPPVTVSPPASNGISGSGTTYTVTVNGVTGTGQLRLDLVANASIVDPQPNGNVTGFTTGSSYNVILPEPTNDNTSFSATAPALNPNSSVTIDWKNPAGGQRPTHILIVGILNGVGTFPPVNDASLVAPSGNWNTSHGAVVVDYTGSYPSIPANDSYTIDNLLLSGKQYDFRIYPYTKSPNNANNNVDYKTTAVLSGSYTVPLASATTIIAGTTPPTSTISSVLAGSNTVFSFKIVDDGGTSADNAPTLISNLVINKTTLGLNTIANWTDAIASAQLVDITQNSGSPIPGTVGANSISFVLTTASGNPGYIGQNLTKEYQLRITLKNPFTASLDNQRFDFTINPAISGSITYATGSSKIAGGELENSGGETIQVVSTALRFTTQPAPTAQLILTDFSTKPIIKAVDGNGNVDVDFTGTSKDVTITTPGSTTRMNNPGTDVTSFVLTPVNGVIDFNVLAPNLQYNDTNPGTSIVGTLVATGGGLSSTSGAGFADCSNITVDYSQTSTIGSATGISTISSITATSVNVFTFTVTDDGGAGGDGAATKISGLKFTAKSPNNQFTNFQDLMASATLSDGTNTQTITSATGLNTTDLTFSAIANGPGSLGNVPDSNSKIYTLSIVLKTPLLGGSLPSTADNKRLVLELIRNATNITFNATGSTIPLGAPTIDSGTTNGVFQVFATKLDFTTQPAASYLVNVPLSAQSIQPVVEAIDIRNNRDLDYNAPVTTTTSVVSRSGQPTTFKNVPVGDGGIITGGAGVAFGFGDMQFTTIGTGAAITVTSATPNANAVIPTAALSSSFNVQVGQSSTIGNALALGSIPSTATSAGTAAPVFSFKVTDDAIAPNDGNPTLVTQIKFTPNSSLNSSELNKWRDAIAGAILSDDNLPTANTYTVNLSTPGAITDNSITFDNISIGNGQLGYISDSPTLGAKSKTYTLSIWLKSTLASPLPITIDGKSFGFDVKTTADVLTDVNGTRLVSGTAITPSGNAVNVVATKLNYMTLAPTGTPVVSPNTSAFSAVPSAPFQTSTYIYVPFENPKAIGVEAVDVNGNRDLNFNGTISAFSANGLTFKKDPLDATAVGKVFSGGTFAFDPKFVYTTGDNQDGSITMSTTGPVLSSQTSTAINIQSSKDSYVYFDPNFAAQNFNNFVNQQAGSLPNKANATVATLARVVLSDGGAANHNTTPTFYPFGGDADKAFTRISEIEFTVTRTGTGDLRTVALYDSALNKISGDVPAGSTISFTGLNIEADDDDTLKFTLRGSFIKNATDGDKITFAISRVKWSAGSFPLNYNNNNGPYFGGVNGGDISKQNNVDVVATSLDFTTPPSPFAGINEPIGTNSGTGKPYSYGSSGNLILMPSTTAGSVTARDKFANIDTGFSPAPITLSIKDAANNTLGSPKAFSFTNGVMDLTGMTYPNVGNGAVKLIANGIDSSLPAINTTGTITTLTTSSTVNGLGTKFLTDIYIGARINDSNGNLIGTVQSITNDLTLVLTGNAAKAVTNSVYNTSSIPCRRVDVLNVTVSQDFTNVVPGSGTPLSASLKGGLLSQRIFGLQFTANQVAGTDPALKEFTIGFKGVNGQNLAYENGSTVIFKNFSVVDGSGNNITTFGGTLTKVSSTSTAAFDQIVVRFPSPGRTLSLGSISLFLIADVDANTNSGTPTIIPFFKDSGWENPDDQNSVVSNGTSSGTFEGNQYSFASTKPPILQASEASKTRPFAGQSNVDPNVKKIVLQFDTNVSSLDGGGSGNAELWSRKTNTKVADLVLNTTTLVTPAPPKTPTAPHQKGVVSPQNTVSPVYETLLYDIKNGPSSLTADEVYFVKIVQGSYDPINKVGRGIADYGLNFFGGISDNSTLYFKISSDKKINLLDIKSKFNSTTLGTLTTTFDQLGTAYYLIVKQGDPAPTIAQVKDSLAYMNAPGHSSATVGAFGSYKINSVSSSQTHTFKAQYVSGTNYSVYLFAENNATPNPVDALGIYDANKVPGGSGGPTLTISGIPNDPVSKTPNNVAPNNLLLYKLCPDSYITITEPMIISEAGTKFSLPSVDQDFNILLPSGFQFDITVSPNVQLIGKDFKEIALKKYSNSGNHPMWEYSYLSNTLINIRFRNEIDANPDFIAISGFRIIGKAGSPQNSILWFFGNNVFTNSGNSTFDLAQIALVNAKTPKFNNSYWANNQFPTYDAPGQPVSSAFAKTVNAIPDNYIDPANPGAIRLLPDTRQPSGFIPDGGFAPEDYLASFFSGSGVSGDLLTLSAVQIGAAFNISMAHTDLNGCQTITTEQYVVYDHNSPISKKLGETRYSTTPSSPAGTKKDIVNTKFPKASTDKIIPSDSLGVNESAGYTLLQLTADLPANAVNPTPSIPMSGLKWQNLIKNNLITTIPKGVKFKHHWDYGKILQADSLTLNANASLGLSNVYDYFKSISGNNSPIPISPNGNNYWIGGSLGKIQFTGIYQSTADNSVYIPLRQDVEIFVPAVPLIEVISPQPSYDKLDTASTANFNSKQYPITNKTKGYPGTATFCKEGGPISLNAYPIASSGQSTGSFQMYDNYSFKNKGVASPVGTGTITSLVSSDIITGTSTNFSSGTIRSGSYLFDASGKEIGIVKSIQSETQLTLTGLAAISIANGVYKYLDPITPKGVSTAFTDNGNGTMTFDPKSIDNANDNIIVTYTYKDNNSPAVGTGYLIIRVTPNPIAKFTIKSVVSPTIGDDGASAFFAFCQGNQIQFSADSSSIKKPGRGNVTPANTILNYAWNFGDPNSGSANAPATEIPSPPGPPIISPGGQAGVSIDSIYLQRDKNGKLIKQTHDKPVHIYKTSSTFTVNLTLTSKWGCTSATSATSVTPTILTVPGNKSVLYAGSKGDIKVGEIPKPKFTFTGNCVGSDVTFDAKDSEMPGLSLSNSVISRVIWDFDTKSKITSNPDSSNLSFITTKSTTAKYSKPGFYSVRLTTISDVGNVGALTAGCQSSIVQQIAQLPVSTSNGAGGAFEENFDISGTLKGGGWLPLDIGGAAPKDTLAVDHSSSWRWDDTLGKWLAKEKATKTYNQGEKSALYSACLNISNVPRPMISFKTKVDVNPGEGLIVQYSTDDKNILSETKNWTTLGKYVNNLSSGLDWYKDAGQSVIAALSGNPSGYGWTSSTGFIQPRHVLDSIPASGLVILRFALAGSSSLTPKPNGGVQIDSIRVGSRTRTILFENFKSTDANGNDGLNTELKNEAIAIKQFNFNNIKSTQVVNVNYHVGFVGKDPFNLDNPADPSSRALFYNVSKVPYAFLDGLHSPQYGDGTDSFAKWGQNAYNLQTLQLAKADFSQSSVDTVNNSIRIKVKPDIDLPEDTRLFVGILETKVTNPGEGPSWTYPNGGKITTNEKTLEYILKKFVPNALGIKIENGFKKDVLTETTVGLPASVFYSNRYSVVLFLQNIKTKEVYQAELNPGKLPTDKTNDYPIPSVTTGVEPFSPESVNIYPNPANQEFVIELPQALSVDANVTLVDQMGRTLDGGLIPAGRTNKSVGTYDLAAGVYIVQIKSDNGDIVRKKVVIVH
jgi:hypothetical protein